MYIADSETNSQARPANASLAAGTALGESVTLTWDALKKAVFLNRRYVRHIGWMPYTRQIANMLGITAPNPDVWSFVQALANWQARNGMMPSGVLGGGEWYAMQTPHRP